MVRERWRRMIRCYSEEDEIWPFLLIIRSIGIIIFITWSKMVLTYLKGNWLVEVLVHSGQEKMFRGVKAIH